MAHLPLPQEVPVPTPPYELPSKGHLEASKKLGRMSPSVYNHSSKLLSPTYGRASPAHDLGYHTLVTRQLDPRRSPSPWTELPQRCPRASPRPPPPQVPADTEQLLTMYKGKRLHSNKPFDRLPDHLVLNIFSFLSTNEICECARVCRRWYFLAWEPRLWSSVTLTGETTNADRAIKQITKLLCRDPPHVCATVDRVVLNGCSRLTDRGLSLLARRCPELRNVQLKGCSNITNHGLSLLVTQCSSLLHLDVTGCTQVTCVASGDPGGSDQENQHGGRPLQLQYLDMTDCHNLQDSGLKITVRSCPALQHLYLRRCTQVTDGGIKYVSSYCQTLREFSISDCVQVTDFGMYELAKLGANLRYLSVAKCDQVSDAGIKQIGRHCYKLRYLNVRGCEAVSDVSMETLARTCPRLRALDIGKCDVTDHGLKLLSENCPNLKKLSVKSCEMISDDGVQCIAYYCRGLQQLNIQDCPISVEGYRTVRRFCKRCIIEHTNPGF